MDVDHTIEQTLCSARAITKAETFVPNQKHIH